MTDPVDAPGPERPGGTPRRGVPAVVVMGVSGCGKTTVGQLLAPLLGGEFLDGDALHPEANIAKMAAGTPLDDADRRPWLEDIGRRLGDAAGGGKVLVIGCSALKRGYRDLIRGFAPQVVFVHLHGDRALLERRMGDRPGHFMPPALLDSQLATLEPLGADEGGRVHDLVAEPERIAREAADWIALHGG